MTASPTLDIVSQDEISNRLNSLKEYPNTYIRYETLLHSILTEYNSSKTADDFVQGDSFTEFNHFLPLVKTLFHRERFQVWNFICNVKAFSVPEIVRETGVSQPCVWRTIKVLIDFKIVILVQRVPNPKYGTSNRRRSGNETYLYALMGTSPEVIKKAVSRTMTNWLNVVEEKQVAEKQRQFIENNNGLFAEFIANMTQTPRLAEYRNWLTGVKNIKFQTAKKYAEIILQKGGLTP